MKPLHGDKLWNLLRKNDKIAFAQLYEQQWEPLFQFAWRILRNREDAKGIVQNLFINLWNKRNVLPDVQSPEDYLSTAIRNSTLHFLQQRDNDTGLLQRIRELGGQEVQVPEPVRKENNSHLLKLTGQLPNQLQRVIVLHLFQDLSVREIADCTGTAELTIRHQIDGALKELRKLSGTLFP